MKRWHLVEWFVRFEKRDWWIGVYWNSKAPDSLDVYICLIPTLPVVLWFER